MSLVSYGYLGIFSLLGGAFRTPLAKVHGYCMYLRMIISIIFTHTQPVALDRVSRICTSFRPINLFARLDAGRRFESTVTRLFSCEELPRVVFVNKAEISEYLTEGYRR